MKTLERAVRAEPLSLFQLAPTYEKEWWGMPDFAMGDARPSHRVVVNFATREDLDEFARRVGLPVTSATDSVWFPYQEPLRGEFYWAGPKTPSRYPVCIPSKGRAKTQKTGGALDALGVEHRFFVEQREADEYRDAVGESRVIEMPFSDLGQGSIPARNFIWEWARERGHARHWVVDDNIVNFYRTHNNRRLTVRGGGFFAAMEDFVDRYENVAMAGPHDIAFVPDRAPSLTPLLWNNRVYSCILLDTGLPDRWRGRYNEDTDLSLRLLKQGWCTLLFRALCMDKPTTSGAKGTAMAGGNTDNVYNTDDARRAFAESLVAQHPDVASVTWKFNRWHHEVDYRPFAENAPRLRPGVVPIERVNDYGMRLCRRSSEEASK